MSLSPNDHISLYAAIDEAASMLQLNNYNSLLEDFARWGYQAEGKIGSTDTFRRFECELEVENNMACLPDNLVYINALKIGSNWIDVTKRDFQMFRKGLAIKAESTPRRYIGGNQVLSNPGQAGSLAVLFQGTFLQNDVITITVTVSNGSAGPVNHVFQYVVLPGDITNDIITQFQTQINAIMLPFSAQVNLSTQQLIINGRDATVNFTLTLGTTSLTGTLSQIILQRRVAPTECEPCIEDNSNMPKSGSVNLANRSAVNLNNQMDGKMYMNALLGFNDFSSSNSVHAVINGHIHFNNISNGKVGISYMGFMLDDNGWVMVKNNHILAVASYIVYKYTQRELYAGRMSKLQCDTADRDWHWECGQARGDDEMLDRNGMIYLSRMWNQFIPLPNKNLF